MGRYLYVLSGYAGANPLKKQPDTPAFEFQRFVETYNADLFSLTNVRKGHLGLRTKLSISLMFDRLRLAALVARRSNDYSAVFASGEDIGILIALLMRLLRRKSRLVIITHGPQFTSKRFARVVSLVKTMPNVFFACLSQSLANKLIDSCQLAKDRCLPVGYGIDVDFYKSVQKRQENLIASAGVSHRDYQTLIKAVNGLGVVLKIAADSTWVGSKVEENSDFTKDITFQSAGNYYNLRELYRDATIVVVPTFDVPFAAGFAVIGEAMASGAPVIACDGIVTSDFIVNGVSGLLVAPQDSIALQSAILTLIKSPELAAEMGKAAAARMSQTFSLDQYVERLMAVGVSKATRTI